MSLMLVIHARSGRRRLHRRLKECPNTYETTYGPACRKSKYKCSECESWDGSSQCEDDECWKHKESCFNCRDTNTGVGAFGIGDSISCGDYSTCDNDCFLNGMPWSP